MENNENDIEKNVENIAEKEAKKKVENKVAKKAENKAEKKTKKVAENKNGEIPAENADGKKKKIMLFSIIGGVSLIVIIAIICLIVNLGKISKGDAEKLVKSYITAVNDKDSDKYMSLVDVKGYITLREDGEKKFKDKYKNKDKYINKYIDEKNYDDIDDVKKEVENSFNSQYKYSSNEYSFKEIKEITKSKKSSNIVIVKAKVKVKSKYSSSTDTKTLVLYTVKVNGKYKIIGEEIR